MSTTPYNALPLEAKKALIQFYALDVDHGDFTVPQTLTSPPTEQEWIQLLEEGERVWGNDPCVYFTLSFEEAKTFVWDNTPDLHTEHADFDTYHAWYCQFKIPNYTESRWPCISYPQGDEALLDGWHRFHRYVQLKAEQFAFVHFL